MGTSLEKKATWARSRWSTEAAGGRRGETGKIEQLQAEYPRKDLSPEPEPFQQSRQRLLKKGEREHLPPSSKGQGD